MVFGDQINDFGTPLSASGKPQDEGSFMSNGIRVVLVMNRKGGSGKSTLCRALASAAAARGETVTIFGTETSLSCLHWM